MQADIFDLPVYTMSASGEGGAYGAILVAGVGAGVWGSLEEAASIIKVETETLPIRENQKAYQDGLLALLRALRRAQARLRQGRGAGSVNPQTLSGPTVALRAAGPPVSKEASMRKLLCALIALCLLLAAAPGARPRAN